MSLFAKHKGTFIWFLAILSFLVSNRAVAEDSPSLSKRALVEIGKNATGLIFFEDKPGSGSCFCIHPNGVFVTNKHVVNDLEENATVNIVFNPGTQKQKLIKAKLVHKGEDIDLALLQAVDGKPSKKFDSLNPSDGKDLFETMEVTAFGFPFGKALAFNKGKYPEITVSGGNINSLRKKDNDLALIQLDAALNPGNSGGPVLDENGKVVGIVVSGVPGSGVNFAISVNQLRKFLKKPVVKLELPDITEKNAGTLVTIKAKIARFNGQKGILTVNLLLGENKRIVPLFPENDTYVGKTIVFDEYNSDKVNLILEYSKGYIDCLAQDRSFTVGEKRVKLSQVDNIVFSPKPVVTPRAGAKSTGAIKGLDEVVIQLGQISPTVDFSKAQRVTVNLPKKATEKPYILEVKSDGELISQIHGEFKINGKSKISYAPPKLEVVRPGSHSAADDVDSSGSSSVRSLVPVSEGTLSDTKNVKLPSTIDDCIVGGSGRYLIFHMKKIGKLVVFDVLTLSPKHYIPMPSSDIIYAAGQDDIVVFFPAQKLMRRYSLESGKLLKSKAIPFEGPVLAAAMGAGSSGPMLVRYSVGTESLDFCSYALIDPRNLQTINTEPIKPRNRSYRDRIHIRASLSSRLFGIWCTSHSPSGLVSMVLNDGSLTRYYSHDSVGFVVPASNDNMFFTCQGVYSSETQLKFKPPLRGKFPIIPALRGNFHIKLTAAKERDNYTLEVCSVGASQALYAIPGTYNLGRYDQWKKNDFTLDKRVVFIPQAKLLLLIPLSNDQIIARRLDVTKELAQSDFNYFFVSTTPPVRAKRGSTFVYQIKAMSKKGTPTYRLETGPSGMRVSSDGKVTWRVSHTQKKGSNSAVVVVDNGAGDQIFHTFHVNVY